MNPASAQPGTVSVYLDGALVRTVEVTKDMLYRLIELERPGDHQLELQFNDAPIEAYAFTFG